MKLAIVGSTSLVGNEEAREIIAEQIRLRSPHYVISGGALGVDTMAVEVARAMGIPTLVYRPEVQRWDGGDRIGFKQRNRQIAEACDELIRIAAKDARTYGSGWTRDEAARLGKPTVEFVVEVQR